MYLKRKKKYGLKGKGKSGADQHKKSGRLVNETKLIGKCAGVRFRCVSVSRASSGERPSSVSQ